MVSQTLTLVTSSLLKNKDHRRHVNCSRWREPEEFFQATRHQLQHQ